MPSAGIRVSRVRVGFQVLLHALIVTHVVAYYFYDWTRVGGIDFQDFFFSLVGHGVVTIAVLFTAAMYLLSIVFGRLFCSWGCHFGATQDLAAWVLRRLGWTPPHLRTRFLDWSPYLVLVAVFLWPSLERWLDRGWRFQGLELAGGGPWERLPGTLLSIVTFAVCGAGILLFLGRRGFCRFVCPYGALFRVTGRLAPFRVTRVKPCASETCNSGVHPCTSACPTAIDVHGETTRHGAVTGVDCVQCHLCIEACPEQALSYTLARRAKRTSAEQPLPSSESTDAGFMELPVLDAAAASPPDEGGAGARPSSPYALGRGEEVLVLAAALITFAACDLVYGGHFLSASLALTEGFLVLLALRTVRRRDLSLGPLRLRSGGAWRFAGITVVGTLLLSFVPIYQAGAFKVWRSRASTLWSVVEARLAEGEGAAVDERGRQLLAEAARNASLALWHVPSSIETRELLCNVLCLLGRGPEAIEQAEEIARRRGHDDTALDGLSRVYTRFGKIDEARLVNEELRERRRVAGGHEGDG